MDFFGPIWAIGNCLWVPIKRRINYVKDLRGNFQILNKEVQYLYNRKADIECEINRDMVSKMVTNECKAWLEKVREVEIKMDVIEAELKENKKCLSGWCPWPNICWRKKVGRCIVQVLDDVAKLKEESEFGGGVVADAPLKAVEKLPSSVAEGNTSTDRTVRKILDCIKDDRVQKIGVWGMGGVGKTRVLKIVNNLPEICQMFQIVIWVTVSSSCSLRKVQNEIAQRLSLNLAGESDERIARKLWKHLETKKYLLLLDDLWQRIDLEAVGVPNPSKENGCKIVLTSRSLGVCNKMETNKEIKVEILSNEEAWRLFHEKVGEVVDFPGITQIARCVVDECRGLPLAILVIGGSLRNENNVRVWRNALKELSSAKYEIIDDIEDSVFNKLKFSYDQLSNENVRNCFLYAALYPEDFEIPVAELIEHWLWEGFITEGEKNMEEAQDKGHAIVNRLVNASLLERIEREHQLNVKMHDVIRDLALRITSPSSSSSLQDGRNHGHRFLVRAGRRTDDPPDREEWKHVHKISLMQSGIWRLPEAPECTSLLTLLLQNNYDLETIPESFFEHMHNLRVLNLSLTSVQELPSSFCKLESLQVLNLSGTSIQELPSSFSKLESLRVLNLSETAIHELRPSLFKLSNLQVLNLSMTKIRELPSSFPKHVNLRVLNLSKTAIHELPFPLSNLVNLKDLDLSGTDIQELPLSLSNLVILRRLYLRSREIRTLPCQIGNLKSLEVLHLGDYIDYLPTEVGKLTHLRSLHVSFRFSKILEEKRMIPNGMLFRLPLLEDLSLNIGGVYWNDHRPVIDENWSSIAEAVAEELATLKRLNHLNFFFTKMESFSRFIRESCAWKDKCLTSFRLLVGCDDIETLHTSYFEHEHEGVRYLRLRGTNDISNKIMEVLRRACAFRLICHEIARYLSEFGLENMNGLEFCEVGYCKKMETLVLIDDGNGLTCSSSSNSSRSHAVLPRIEMLHLHNLHSFMTIWGKGPVPPQSLNCLRILKVENCPMLQYLFSKPAAQQLSTLQQLEVRSCPKIQEIVNGRDGKSSDDEFIYLLQLKHLKLVELPKLVSICKGVSLVALSSFSVRAYDCPNLKCEWWVDDGTGQMVKKA